jgi:hypothetical protein
MSYLKMALAAMKAATGEGKVGAPRQDFDGQATNHTPSTKTPSATIPERILTCADCPHFEVNHGPNPGQGWGWCQKRKKGRYGCATACEAAITDAVLGG